MTFLAAVVLLTLSGLGKDGHGCEKLMNKVCPGWKDNSATCTACVESHVKDIEGVACGKGAKKALVKCQTVPPNPSPSPSPPTPSPSPPSPLPPAVPHLPPRPAPSTQPNIFFMLTDDQDIQLGSMNAMSFTRGLVATGANLTNFFAHTPVCCPSRSELLTGRYLHNLRTSSFDSSSNCMHVNASVGTKTGDPLTFAVPLQQAGYATGVYGKYLNSGGMEKICSKPTGDGSLLVPAGWDDFMGACPDTCYTDCNYNINGESVDYKNASYELGSNYGTSVIGNRSLQFMSTAMKANWPFFVLVASHAPHGPATPAPWYKDLYSTPDVIAPRTPAFGVHSPDKHWMVATEPALTPAYIEKAIDSFYKNRMRSLRSVDDIVAGAHAVVAAAGQLDKTYFVFTSDHGLHMGQFCLGPCKRQPYETDIRIPMAIVGPGIAAGEMEFVSSIPDLAPTFVALANASSVTEASGLAAFDGRSFAHLVNPQMAPSTPGSDTSLGAWRDAHLVEYFATDSTLSPSPKQIAGHLKDMANNTFIGLRIINSTMNLAYFEFTNAVTDWAFEHSDFCELYLLDIDPHQLKNVCSSADRGMIAALHTQLRAEFNCAGGSCQ